MVRQREKETHPPGLETHLAAHPPCWAAAATHRAACCRSWHLRHSAARLAACAWHASPVCRPGLCPAGFILGQYGMLYALENSGQQRQLGFVATRASACLACPACTAVLAAAGPQAWRRSCSPQGHPRDTWQPSRQPSPPGVSPACFLRSAGGQAGQPQPARQPAASPD